MHRELARILSRLSLLTQLGLSLVTPPLLLLWGAMWLQSRFGVGDWILLCAILCGILSGGCAAYNLIRAELLSEKRRQSSSADSDKKGNKDET